jgi:NADH-quinone oxidoreductase subunit C
MLTDKLKERFGADLIGVTTTHGEETISVARDRAPQILRALRDEPAFAFNFLTDLSAVDWDNRKPRFDVVYHLNSLTLGHRLRVKIGVEASDPSVASVVELWKAADWLERDCFDMFGIIFTGHPDLRRILLYDTFEGHPLRKDYPATRRQPIVPEIDPVTNPRRSSR